MKKEIVTMIIGLFGLGASVVQGTTPEIQQAIFEWETGNCEEAYRVFEQYKDAEDPDALAYIGRSLWNGAGVEQNKEKAFEYFMKAADLGQPYGLNGVGIAYLHGEGTAMDWELAEEYLIKAAEAGCPLSEYNLGNLYNMFYLGKKEETWFEKAVKHYMVSYEAGNLKPNCAEKLGLLYASSQNYDKSLPFLHEAADNNMPEALRQLAEWYENGVCVARNCDAAIDYAERLGNVIHDNWLYSNICYRTGMDYYFRGQWRAALVYLRMAADAGNIDAMYQVSRIHPDQNVSGQYAVKASENGCRLVLCNAGCYLAGNKQYDKAMNMYQEAVKDGNPQAMCEIAIMHRIGEGVPVDYDTSMEWYEKAAQQYYSRALRELGIKYLLQYNDDQKKGFYTGTHPKLSKACAYIAMACMQNDDSVAWEKLRLLYEQYDFENLQADNPDMELAKGLTGIYYGQEQNLKDGVAMIRQAAAHGNVDAMVALGWLYRELKVFSDLKQSLEYYKMAADRGNDFAEKQLCAVCYTDLLDENKLVAILQAQSDKGYSLASCNLGAYYDEKNEPEKAAELYLKAARNGDFTFLPTLMMMCYDKQIAMDKEEADSFIAQALSNHVSCVELFTGFNLLKSNDPGDIIHAKVLLMLAILDGDKHPEAYGELGRIYCNGNGVPREPDFAISLLQYAVGLGGYDYCTLLGDMMPDLEQAKEIYELGAKNGIESCKKCLQNLEEVEVAPAK